MFQGYSFGAGTVDGPGEPFFTQGTLKDNFFWNIARNVLTRSPSAVQTACHYPKPILLNTGEVSTFINYFSESMGDRKSC